MMGRCKYCGGDTGRNKKWCNMECRRAYFSGKSLSGKYKRKEYKSAYIPQKNEQLCWTCQKATTGECSWSRKLIPVDGWDAVPSKVHASGFRIRQCPEYVSDKEIYGI